MEQASGLGGAGGLNDVSPMFSFYLTSEDSKKGSLTIGGYNLLKFAKPGKTDKDIFWANMAHKKTFFWTLNMGQISFNDGGKFESTSKHMVLDSGLSYALIPSEDFKKLTEMLSTKYGVKCVGEAGKDNFSAQVSSSDCSCQDVHNIPSLKMQIFADGNDTKGR